MHSKYLSACFFAFCCMLFEFIAAQNKMIDLSGTWSFKRDDRNVGIGENWFLKNLDGSVKLPGSMTSNGLGDEIALSTPWTGEIVDSSWFFNSEDATYRQPGNIKIPFWLQPSKYFRGAAWYKRTFTIPFSSQPKVYQLFIERAHIQTMVWIDGVKIGGQDALGTPQQYMLGSLSPGNHIVTVRVDNGPGTIDVGWNSHSISDHTQGNWNGMVGKICVIEKPLVYLEDVRIFPNIKTHNVVVKCVVQNHSSKNISGKIGFQATLMNGKIGKELHVQAKDVIIAKAGSELEIEYDMGNDVKLWDEFTPHLYKMTVTLTAAGDNDKQEQIFGMRAFKTYGTQFTINGRPTFLRGTLECSIFPKTGFPPTDERSWERIFRIAKSYGLNHMRFHSWCPPEAAFIAADKAGFYLQIECSSWANSATVSLGDGKPIDNYIREESERVIRWFGNHPSFCMMVYGNEPAGDRQVKYLTDFVEYWKAKDSRHLYSTASGWPLIEQSDYNSTPDPRIQLWGAGLKSIINGQPPRTDYDWSGIISKWRQPTVSHEIGQWCVYPDFKEIKAYDGVFRAKNFEIFSDRLQANGLMQLADSFLLASGKLQALCYKADIEAALRTKNFGGFQLLDLHDFPGQGTALVGVLNPFWEDKGYITGREFSRFCNSVVPLARFPKMIFNNNETLEVPVEIAQFGKNTIEGVTPAWEIANTSGEILFHGNFKTIDLSYGNGLALGTIRQSLATIKDPSQLKLTVSVSDYKNAWDFFVYPSDLPEQDEEIFVTQKIDEKMLRALQAGKKVLVTLRKHSLKDEAGGKIKLGFSSIFWNTAWTKGQAPTTLGILCDPGHPAFDFFPTEYYSNWQWWDAMSHSNAILLDAVKPRLQPIVRVIDDWVTAKSLGLIFECNVEKGRLLFSSIDLITDSDKRPAARQLLFSLKKYIQSDHFLPQANVAFGKIKGLVNN